MDVKLLPDQRLTSSPSWHLHRKCKCSQVEGMWYAMFFVKEKSIYKYRSSKNAFIQWILGWLQGDIWTNRTPGCFLSGGVAGCMGFPDFHCIPGRLGDIFCGGWRTRSFEQWTSRKTGYLHLMIILMAIPVNMNEFQTFAVVVFGGDCDVVVVGFLVNDFGWLWMPLFCPMIGLRINNRGHVRCHTGVLHLRVPTQLIEPLHRGCVLSVQIGKALTRFLSFRPSFCWIMVRVHGHASVERISNKLAICLV